MKNTLRRSMLLLSLLATYASASAEKNEKPFVIPELKEWKGNEGLFEITPSTRIVCVGTDGRLREIANQLAQDLKSVTGKALTVGTGKPASGDIVLSLRKNGRLGNEGYRMNITSGEARLEAPTTEGVYQASRTLLQIAEQDAAHALPCGEIIDYPDYRIRGFMLDCGRKYIPMDYLRDLVKVMSYYKMNTLQVHLNDNAFKQYYGENWDKTYAAFRLESDTYPGLEAFDGYYTKDEFREFQKEALKYGVEIIPEVDVPAHALAFTQYMPEIGSEEYGMDHLDIFNPKTYEFVDALLDEYLTGEDPVFVGKRVHIGTDEYSNAKKEVVEKFRYFTDYYIRYVEQYGKQAVVWGSLSHAAGDTPVKSDNVLMGAWSTYFADPDEMVRQGYQLISVNDHDIYIVPGASYYQDYLDTKRLYETWLPENILKNRDKKSLAAIEGGMFAVWNDHAGNGVTTADIHHRFMPALHTLSAKMWTGANVSEPYESFDKKRQALSEAPGVNRLARVGAPNTVIYEAAELLPQSTTGIQAIGYDYTVSFDLNGRNEEAGTALFSSPDGTFFLSDPVNGFLGFMRDGYLDTFRYSVRDGRNARLRIEGDKGSVSLFADDRLVDRLDRTLTYYNGGKDSLEYIPTFIFPLQKTGDFKSEIRNLEVKNYIEPVTD